MNITIETKGNHCVVTVELSDQESVDKYGYGVLTNNKFENIANVFERQVNDRRALLYRDLPAKTVNDWLNEKVNDISLLTMLRSITTVTTSIGAFSLFPEGLLMDPETIFVTDKGAAKFIYIPIEGVRQQNSALGLIRDILQRVDPKNEVCAEYIETLSALYSEEDLSVDRIKETVDKLSGKVEKEVAVPKEIEENESIIPGNIVDKNDHSDFVIRKQPSSHQLQKKADSVSLPQSAGKPMSDLTPAPGTGASGLKAAPVIPRKANEGMGDFMIPGGADKMIPWNEKKRKSRGAKSGNMPFATPGNSMQKDADEQEQAPKKKMNLTEMLIAWIKKLKAKKAADASAQPQKDKKQKKNAKPVKAMPQPHVPMTPGAKETHRENVGSAKRSTVPEAPALTSTSPKTPVPKGEGIKTSASKGNEKSAAQTDAVKKSENLPKQTDDAGKVQTEAESAAPAMKKVSPAEPAASITKSTAPVGQVASDEMPNATVQTNKANGNIQIIVNLPSNQGQPNAVEYIDQLRPKLTRARTGEVVVVDRGVFKIGKEKGYVNYFIQDNPHISRAHANILSKEGKYFIVDTNSTNHTYVNGEKCESNDEIPLKNGDMIRLANEDFTFTCQE